MTTTSGPAPNRAHGTGGELARFLVIGVLTVVVDFVTYRLLLRFGVETGWAKAIGFVTGTVFAYFANRLVTFAGAVSRRGSALRFVLLYACTLGVNVAVNGALLALGSRLAAAPLAIGVAFVCATALSATLNFLGMKFFVFESHRTVA